MKIEKNKMLKNKRNELKMNVKPKFFKVMKQKFFTLVMMLALVIVAGSTFGQTKFTPYAGAVYSYSIDITVYHQADATLTATGLTTGTSVISNLSPASLTDLAVGSHTITFDVTYSGTATGTCVIALNVVEEGTLCSNNIHVNCVVQTTPPSMDLAINVGDNSYGCQNLNLAPGNNADASVGAPTNTITYSVASANAPTGLDHFDYTIGVSGATCTTCGPATADDTYDATFSTAGGAGFTVTGTLTGATFTMDAAHGGQTYNMNVTTDHQDVTVDALPTIGTFN
jgi:hypothetical protein